MSANLQKDELIARYLLGELPEEQQVEIENRAFSDPEYLKNITAVENDLIDEYVRQELSSERRRQFEQRFFASADRRKRVEFARALATVVSEGHSSEAAAESREYQKRPSFFEAVAAFIQGLAPASRFSLASATLLIMIAGGLLIMYSLRQRADLTRLRAQQQQQETNERALQQQIETERKRNDELRAQLGQEKEQRQKTDELVNDLQRDVEKPVQQPEKTLFALSLLPGISRSGGARPKLALPESARVVRLQIGLEPEEQYKTFRVELKTQDGQPVWNRDNLPVRTTRTGKTVALTLPASVLSASQYELTLKGLTETGKVEAVGFYYFDIERR
jgi:anti-sigma-K factor RskA